MQKYSCVCKKCIKNFDSLNKESSICFGCALQGFAPDRAPEEGDINSALITSGDMSDQDARQLQEDLQSIDHCDEEAHWRRMLEYYDDDSRWDYLEEDDEDE